MFSAPGITAWSIAGMPWKRQLSFADRHFFGLTEPATWVGVTRGLRHVNFEPANQVCLTPARTRDRNRTRC